MAKAAHQPRSRRFVRAVHIERDFEDISALKDYILTDSATAALDRIIETLDPHSRRRAWRLTGNYGSGKSSFALVLAQLLSHEEKQVPGPLRKFIKRRVRHCGPRTFVPLLITASRGSLAPLVLQSIVSAMGTLVPEGSRPPAFVAAARRALELLDPAEMDAQALRALDELTAYLTSHEAASGVCLVIDEMGKILEYAAMHPTRQDVYLLQQIAERSFRKDGLPLLVLAVLHQGLAAYTSHTSLTLRKEWEKVSGRFEEIVFQPTLEQSMLLAGAALHGKPTLGVKLQKQVLASVHQLAKLGWFGSLGEPKPDLLLGIYPIHPSAFPVLVRLFQRFGQNERSLYGFLLTEEPHGLQKFLASDAVGGSSYHIHQIYNYISSNFSQQLRYEPGSRWELLEALVESYMTRGTDDELQILKTIAVLNLLDSQGLVATEALLRLAVPIPPARFDRALDNLTRVLRVLHNRGHAGGYCIWPHTSVDIVECHTRAERELGRVETVANNVKQILNTRPIVARRHYIETGNLRYFSVHFITRNELSNWPKSCVDSPGDGQVVIVLCDGEEDRIEAIRYVQNLRRKEAPKTLLVGVTPALHGLAPLVQEERCWAWVFKHVPELAGDSFAAAEVSRLEEESRDRLQKALDQLLGLRFAAIKTEVTWYRAGRPQEIRGGRQFLRLISDVCDDVYALGPRLPNELVNRGDLSSAAAAARMRLIERILEFPNEPLLGLNPELKPPEMSMYLSVLHNSGLHTEHGRKGWGFSLPEHDECNLIPALTCITATLQEAAEKRVELGKLIEPLRRPPYGVREGLILLLIAVVCALEEQHIAMYERGSFVRKITGEHFARMMKQPEEYAFQFYTISGVRSQLFRHLLEMLNAEDSRKAVNILDVVRPLLEFAGQLPQYTMRTARLSPEARAVRQAFLDTREPARLIFEELPTACGVSVFTPTEKQRKENKVAVDRFITTLRAVLDELRATYMDLLARLRGTVAEAFDITDTELRAELKARGARVLTSVREPRLKGFCMRLADDKLDDEPWIEALASYVCAKPPKTWFDADTDRFDEELTLLRDRFSSAERLVFAGGENAHAVRVSLTRTDGSQVDRVVNLTDSELGKVAKLEARFRELLGADRRLALAAMSRAMWDAIELTGGSDSTDTPSPDSH